MPVKQQDKKKRGRPAGKPKQTELSEPAAKALQEAESPPIQRSNGRWVKGQSGNPKGRAALPPALLALAHEAPAELAAIVHDPATPPRVKADICKWAAEMLHGKPRQQVDMEAQVESKSIIVELAGDLASWGE